MNTQEILDWGLRELIRKWTDEDDDKYFYDFSKAIREYLKSQGVVIVADAGVVKVSADSSLTTNLYHVESIIKEVKND